MRKTEFLVVMGLASFLLTGCAGKSGEPFKTDYNSYRLESMNALDERQKADLYEAIITADIAEHQQDYTTAMSYYLYAAELSKNQQLIDKSIESAKAAKDPLGLEQAANIWLSISPDNQHALALLLEAQIVQQNLPEALTSATFLIKNASDSDTRYRLLNETVVNKEPRIAALLLRELNKKYPSEPAIIAAQAKFILNMSSTNEQAQPMLSQALLQIEQALAIDPMLAISIRLKALILFQLRRDNEAKSYLNSLFQENPDSVEISQMYGQLLYDLRDYDATVTHYSNWLNKHPSDLEARNYLAASYYALGQYRLSLKHFHWLLDKNFKPQTIAFYCGDSAQKTAQIELAIDCFSRVNEGRFLATAKIQLANLFVAKKQYEQALAIVRAPYELEESGRVKLLTAEVDLLNNHFSSEQAKQLLETALKSHPDNLALLLKKIELYQLTDQPQKLNQLLIQARDLIEPGEKLDRFNLAAAALLQNNNHYQLAVEWLDHAIKLKPNDKDLLYTRALYKEPLGLYAEMIEEFKQLINLFPDDLNIKNALGYTLADLGQDLQYAQALIDNAYQGLPNNAAVIDSKGWLAYRQGDLASAIEYLSRAFQIGPSAETAAHLGEVLLKNGNQPAAEIIWKKGLKIDPDNTILLETLERLKIELR